MPQDRVFVLFNYFSDFGDAVNRRFGLATDYKEYREVVGFEKTLLNGDASIGLRVPLHTLSGNGSVADALTLNSGGLDIDGTDIGDLTVILKYALWRDEETGSALSLGLGITAPTADAENTPFHDTVFHPYVGHLWGFGRFYIQGFTSVDLPVESGDATLLFNDFGVGYFLLQGCECPAPLTAVVPIFEVHVNTPLNHRGSFRPNDLAATPDTVDVTAGTVFEFCHQARFAVGGVFPVSGPRPFDFEVVASLNWRF
jgi:hypothetical protein